MKWNSPSFKALQKTWYQRLADEGFEDAEELLNGEMELKQSAYHPATKLRNNETARLSVEEYYRLLSIKVHESEFRSEIDQLIVQRKSEGKMIKDICAELTELGHTRCRNTVVFTIRRYEMCWGLAKYTPKELNLQDSDKYQTFWIKQLRKKTG